MFGVWRFAALVVLSQANRVVSTAVSSTTSPASPVGGGKDQGIDPAADTYRRKGGSRTSNPLTTLPFYPVQLVNLIIHFNISLCF